MPTAAPTVVGPTNPAPLRPTKSLPQWLIESAAKTSKVTFDPSKHLDFRYPNKIFSMKELRLEGTGLTPNAISEPFPLFTPDAVQQMRAELFSAPVLESCQYASTFAKNMIRGFGPILAPFIFAAWYSSELLNAVSKIAGIELVPALDVEVGHTNVSIAESDSEDESENAVTNDTRPTFSWHFDSYAFVCVVMLSDCTHMKGGETAIRTGTGEVIKMRGPAMGTAVLMQGRYLEHSVMKAWGGRERIAMATPFRPRSPFVKDETVLTGSRPISNNSDLYKQYMRYRLNNLEKRIRAELEGSLSDDHSKCDFDVVSARKFITEQKQYLEAMLNELI